jgi:hypothetical protein
VRRFRRRGPKGVLAATALGVLAAMSLATYGCGDDGGGSPATAGARTSVAAAGTSGTATTVPLTAASLVPDVQGYEHSVPEKLPAPGGQPDIVFSLFRRTGASDIAARLETRVYPSEDIAATDYKAQALGWKSPPPDALGADLKNRDGAPLSGITDAIGYVSTVAIDGNGNHVYTDVYRFGRVIVIQLVLAKDDASAGTLRSALASAVKAKVPG